MASNEGSDLSLKEIAAWFVKAHQHIEKISGLRLTVAHTRLALKAVGAPFKSENILLRHKVLWPAMRDFLEGRLTFEQLEQGYLPSAPVATPRRSPPAASARRGGRGAARGRRCRRA